MAVKVRDYHLIDERRRLSFHTDVRSGQYHPSEWVSERNLNSRDFESSQMTDVPATESRQEVSPFLRSGRGSLRGKLIVTDDWDSSEVNDEIARDFGLEP